MKSNNAQRLIVLGILLVSLSLIYNLSQAHWNKINYDTFPFWITGLLLDVFTSPLSLIGVILFIIGFRKRKMRKDKFSIG